MHAPVGGWRGGLSLLYISIAYQMQKCKNPYINGRPLSGGQQYIHILVTSM